MEHGWNIGGIWMEYGCNMNYMGGVWVKYRWSMGGKWVKHGLNMGFWYLEEVFG